MMHQPAAVRTSHEYIALNEADVKAIFETATHQADALIALYRLVFKEKWDDIESISCWPSCNSFTWKSICQLFMELDGKYHANVVRGGMWMNSGWCSSMATLPNWAVSLSTCEVKMKEGK